MGENSHQGREDRLLTEPNHRPFVIGDLETLKSLLYPNWFQKFEWFSKFYNSKALGNSKSKSCSRFFKTREYERKE